MYQSRDLPSTRLNSTQLRRVFQNWIFVVFALTGIVVPTLADGSPTPNNQPPGFRITGPPERLFQVGRRITWASTPGQLYKLQRWAGDELGVTNDPPWTDLATVRAVGASTFADDPTAINAPRRFYRVAQIKEEPSQDQLPPSVTAPQVRFVTVSNQPAAQVTVKVQDPGGVASVVIRRSAPSGPGPGHRGRADLASRAFLPPWSGAVTPPAPLGPVPVVTPAEP